MDTSEWPNKRDRISVSGSSEVIEPGPEDREPAEGGDVEVEGADTVDAEAEEVIEATDEDDIEVTGEDDVDAKDQAGEEE